MSYFIKILKENVDLTGFGNLSGLKNYKKSPIIVFDL